MPSDMPATWMTPSVRRQYIAHALMAKIITPTTILYVNKPNPNDKWQALKESRVNSLIYSYVKAHCMSNMSPTSYGQSEYVSIEYARGVNFDNPRLWT